MALPLPTIEIPAKTPQPGLGLLTAVPPRDWPDDTHLQTAGGQFEAEAQTAARLYPTACRDVAYDAIVFDGREALAGIYAFNVYASEICTPVGTSIEDARARVNRRLALGAQAAVEQALWGGNGSNVTGIFQALNTAGRVTAVGTTPGVVEGLALAEQALKAVYDGPTFIHARPMMAPFFGNRQVYLDDQLTPQQHLQSHNRSTFVFGNGYAGSSPDNATPPSTTAETIFATGRIFIWQTGVLSPEGGTHTFVDSPTALPNQRRVFALRTYAIGVEGPLFAATITRAN